MISFDAIIVCSVIVFLVIFLYTELLRPTVSFIIAAGALLVFGVINPKEALLGFANEQLWVIILLLMLSGTLSKTKIVDGFFNQIFKGTKTVKGFILRMMVGIGIPSAFLNNTPLVAMMMPYVYRWSKEKNVSASKLLIPLSYASILGGCITLIGTSTNMITNGLAIEYGESSLGIFDFAYVGLPMLFLGGIYVLLMSGRILPDKPSNMDQTESREYFVETLVKKNSPLIGKNIGSAGLRNLEGLFLVEVLRANKRFKPVSPKLVLEEEDVLIFVGDTERILDIADPKMGLSLPKAANLQLGDMREVVEIVLAPQSSLRGRTVRDSDFRSSFNAAILAIHRNGERIPGKIGDIELAAGDAMLVLSGSDFLSRLKKSRDFYLVSKVRELRDIPLALSYTLIVGLLAAIGLAVFGLVPLFTSLFVLVISTIVFKIQRASELRTSVDFELIIMIAMGLALGKGMINSGVADTLAQTVSSLLSPTGGLGLMAGFFVITNLLSAFMTSKAGVAIVLPVALSTAHSLGLPIEPFILVVAFGGAANFITPIGYQTNLMVYGPGGYAFKDYMRFGLPLTILYLVICTLILTNLYDL